jgi:hypothetical protein
MGQSRRKAIVRCGSESDIATKRHDARCQDQTKGSWCVFWAARTPVVAGFAAFIWAVQICADRR